MKRLFLMALMACSFVVTHAQVSINGTLGTTTGGALLTHDQVNSNGAHSWIPYHANGNVYLTGNGRLGTGDFIFRRWAPPSTYSDKFIIKGQTGNVGIATNNPLERLHVNGNTRLQAYEPTLKLVNNYIFDPNGNIPKIEFDNGAGRVVWTLGGQVSGSEAFYIRKHDGAQDLNVLTIKHNDIVGIGTDQFNVETTATGDRYHLYVKGGLKAEEIKVELCTGSWCDYVFEEDYNLKSLAEVEQHIKDKGHLHNTPSAATLEEQGLELKTITINQQEKIEELYLHMIEMDKRMTQMIKKVDVLTAENKNLKAQIEKRSK